MELIFKNYIKQYPDVLKNINIVETIGKCAFSGKMCNPVVKIEDIFKENFSDMSQFRFLNSNWVDYRIAVLLANYNQRSGLRNHNIIAYENEIKFLNYSDFADEIFNIAKTPFEVVFSFSLKKHIAYKSNVQQNKNTFIIYTDRGNALFNRYDIDIWYPIAKAWYTEHKKDKTYFTQSQIAGKSEISSSQIIAYGKRKFFLEDAILQKYRNTLIFQILTQKTLKKNEKSQL
jgi:hypothetical protein